MINLRRSGARRSRSGSSAPILGLPGRQGGRARPWRSPRAARAASSGCSGGSAPRPMGPLAVSSGASRAHRLHRSRTTAREVEQLRPPAEPRLEERGLVERVFDRRHGLAVIRRGAAYATRSGAPYPHLDAWVDRVFADHGAARRTRRPRRGPGPWWSAQYRHDGVRRRPFSSYREGRLRPRLSVPPREHHDDLVRPQGKQCREVARHPQQHDEAAHAAASVLGCLASARRRPSRRRIGDPRSVGRSVSGASRIRDLESQVRDLPDQIHDAEDQIDVKQDSGVAERVALRPEAEARERVRRDQDRQPSSSQK